MASEHTYKEYDNELESVRAKVLEMGGIVEEQLVNSIEALIKSDTQMAQGVMDSDQRVNELEIEVDEDAANAPDEEYYSMKASTMNPGEGDFGEKNMYGGPGDNPMTQRPARPAQPVMTLEAELAAEYESIKKHL